MCFYLLLRIVYTGVDKVVQATTSLQYSLEVGFKWITAAVQAWQDAQARLLYSEMPQGACFYYLCAPLSNCIVETKALWNRDPNGRLVRPP
ncbi:hypothetical protein CLOM_g7639 [Closterium sp. NIES-68]|nr:hypothetical protein CLOM_g7639 [Closterium sp. NIES-68]GJP65848.1 hypothetical protein CLOP_g22757 [Closterium sp. NIES-67]